MIIFKKMNSIYGYKTEKAMQNQQIWDFANNTFNKNFLMYAGISFLAAVVFAVVLKAELTWQPMALVLLSLAVSVIKTERALSDNFTDEGKKKS